MKKGYVVGEYIIVTFFFLILFVGIVDRVVLITSEEVDLAQDYESCANSERIFKELVDNEVEVAKYGINSDTGTVNYDSIKYIYDNKNLSNYNNDTNKSDSFKLAYEIKGFDVQSAYSTPREDISQSGRDSPVAQIWLNHTNGSNSSLVQNVIGIGSAKNTSGASDVYLTIEMVIPNATLINSYTDSGYCSHLGAGDTVTYTQKSYGLLVNYNSKINNGCDHRYIAYTTNKTTLSDWDEHWTRYGPNFGPIQDIQRNNNLIFIRDISFRSKTLDKDYPVYLGNDTLAKLEWGAPSANGCEYKRLYKIKDDDSFLINQSIFDEEHEVNISRNFMGEIKVTSI